MCSVNETKEDTPSLGLAQYIQAEAQCLLQHFADNIFKYILLNEKF